MHSTVTDKCIRTMLAGFILFALCVSNSFADVIIHFDELPNDTGIHVTGTAFDGSSFDVTKLDEVFHISSPQVPGGYAPDLVLSRIGISLTSSGYLVNILESAGGPISDQVWVHQFTSLFTVIDFISDPGQFILGVAPVATVVETGQSQNVLNYLNDRGELVSIFVTSDAEIPEPGTLALVSIAMLGIAAQRRRKQFA